MLNGMGYVFLPMAAGAFAGSFVGFLVMLLTHNETVAWISGVVTFGLVFCFGLKYMFKKFGIKPKD